MCSHPCVQHNLWSSPARIAVAMYLLYTELRFAVFVGVGLLIIMTPLQVGMIVLEGRAVLVSAGAGVVVVVTWRFLCCRCVGVDVGTWRGWASVTHACVEFSTPCLTSHWPVV